MTELTPEARALIDEVQEGDQPRPGAKEETWAALSARIAAGAAAGTAAGAASTATATAGTKTLPLAAKVLIGTLAVGGVGVGAATFLSGDRQPEPPAAPTTPPPAPSPTAVAPAPEPEREPDPEPAPVAEPEPAPVAEAEPATEPAPRKQGKKARPAPLPDASSLMEEQTVLHAMRQARRGGDHGEVLEHARTYRQKFPRGQLRQDAEWLEIEALCELGKVDRGSKVRDAFLKRWPKSPHAGRVRGLCQ